MTTPPSESKTRKSKLVKPPNKICPICKKRKDLSEFYSNPDWAEEQGKDKWCKECFSKLTTKENVKEYFWENRREWSDTIWNQAIRSAEKKLESNTIYQKSAEDRRHVLLERTAVQCVPLFMSPNYHFIILDKNKKHLSYSEAVATGEVQLEDGDPNQKEYDEFFNGYFTKRELDYLQNYYNKLEEDFTFDNENLRDYAKKCARASLQADKAQDDYAAGRCSFADVKDALAQFDMLSKSANFAACKRKTGETSGLTSWAETTLYLETHGYCKETQVTWPQDDVDRIVADLKHTVKALGLDSI